MLLHTCACFYITMLHNSKLVKRVHLADEIHVHRVPESYDNSKWYVPHSESCFISSESGAEFCRKTRGMFLCEQSWTKCAPLSAAFSVMAPLLPTMPTKYLHVHRNHIHACDKLTILYTKLNAYKQTKLLSGFKRVVTLELYVTREYVKILWLDWCQISLWILGSRCRQQDAR